MNDDAKKIQEKLDDLLASVELHVDDVKALNTGINLLNANIDTLEKEAEELDENTPELDEVLAEIEEEN